MGSRRAARRAALGAAGPCGRGRGLADRPDHDRGPAAGAALPAGGRERGRPARPQRRARRGGHDGGGRRRPARSRAPSHGGCGPTPASPPWTPGRRRPGPPQATSARSSRPARRSATTRRWTTASSTGAFTEPGPARVWLRMRQPLVAGEPISPLARVLVAADSGNGVSAALDYRRHLFINTELTVHLIREPAGEWVHLDAVTYVGPHGVGLSESVLHDETRPAGPRRADAARPAALTGDRVGVRAGPNGNRDRGWRRFPHRPQYERPYEHAGGHVPERPLPPRRPDRRRWDVDGLPRLRHHARAARRREADAPRDRVGLRPAGALPPRGPLGGAAQPSRTSSA